MKKHIILITAACLCILNFISFVYADEADKTYDVCVLWNNIKYGNISFEFDDSITVTGIVTETGISIYATPYVSLSNEKGGIVYAVCVLPRADVLKLKEFKKDEEVIIQGNYYAFRDKTVIKKCRKIDLSTRNLKD